MSNEQEANKVIGSASDNGLGEEPAGMPNYEPELDSLDTEAKPPMGVPEKVEYNGTESDEFGSMFNDGDEDFD